MRFALFLCIVFAAAACNQGPLAGAKEEKKDDGDTGTDTKAGTLAVGQQAEAQAIAAATSLQQIADGFVPSSMKTGQVAANDQPAAELLLQEGPPQYCVDHPGDQMCTSCGPGGELSGSQTCAAFFGPGGEGYTEGEQLGGTDGQSGSGSDQGGDGGPQGPCAGTKGFLDCQPVLVRLYLKIAADMVKMSSGIMSQAAAHVKGADSTFGTVQIPDDAELSAIDYKINGEKDMAFLFKNKEGKAVLQAVLLDKKYTIDGSSFGGSDNPDDMSFSQHVEVNFTDEKKWSVDVKLSADKCNDQDAQAPQKIAIAMHRDDTLWQGKANLLMPHWPSGGCSDPVTATSGLSMDTDIQGEKEFTTAAVYMVPLSVETLDLESIKAYSIEKLCTNFPKPTYGICHDDGTVMMNEQLPSNPFCSKLDGSYSWGGPCVDSTFPDVANGVFGQDPWLSPKELTGLSVTVPGSL